MFKMTDKNKEILQLALEGVAKPREIAAAYGVGVNHVYRLRHGHMLKIRNHEAKTQKLREMDKRKKEAPKPVRVYQKHHTADELRQIAMTARKLHASAANPPAPPEDYFERLKMAQAEIDRLVEESVKQKNAIDELTHQNKTLMRVLYRLGHL